MCFLIFNSEMYKFIYRYCIGCVSDLNSGVLLLSQQGSDKGKGNTDGSYQSKTLFSCAKHCGIFAPFSRVRPVVPSSLSPSVPEPSPQPETEELYSGDRVTYFIGDKCRHGMVVDVQEKSGQHFVRISTVSNISVF